MGPGRHRRDVERFPSIQNQPQTGSVHGAGHRGGSGQDTSGERLNESTKRETGTPLNRRSLEGNRTSSGQWRRWARC